MAVHCPGEESDQRDHGDDCYVHYSDAPAGSGLSEQRCGRCGIEPRPRDYHETHANDCILCVSVSVVCSICSIACSVVYNGMLYEVHLFLSIAAPRNAAP